MISVVAKLQAVAGKEEELKKVLTTMVGQVKEKEAGAGTHLLAARLR